MKANHNETGLPESVVFTYTLVLIFTLFFQTFK